MRLSKFYYLYSLIFVFVIPTLIEAYFIYEYVNKINLYTFIIGITLIGSLWDIWATRHGKKDPIWLWQFNKRDCLGITLFDLPIEEFLFYVTTSAYIIFTWESLQHLTQLPQMFIVLPFVAIWTLFFIALPYVTNRKRDRF